MGLETGYSHDLANCRVCVGALLGKPSLAQGGELHIRAARLAPRYLGWEMLRKEAGDWSIHFRAH